MYELNKNTKTQIKNSLATEIASLNRKNAYNNLCM